VKGIAELHPVQLVGLAVFPYATCTDHASVGHTVFSSIFTQVVYVVSLLIVKLPPIGAVLSTINSPLVLVVIFTFHALSPIDHDNKHR
jgi:uncharacterized metal-binding protein